MKNLFKLSVLFVFVTPLNNSAGGVMSTQAKSNPNQQGYFNNWLTSANHMVNNFFPNLSKKSTSNLQELNQSFEALNTQKKNTTRLEDFQKLHKGYKSLLKDQDELSKKRIAQEKKKTQIISRIWAIIVLPMIPFMLYGFFKNVLKPSLSSFLKY
ncbi:MAG: hypothetical protein WDZ41_03800 [Candidatus Babeliales bacterium]